MRILLVSQLFYPEQFKCNELAAELVRRGHDVTVLTGIPNYPKGRFYPGYGLFRKRTEVWKGVKIHRAILIPRGKAKGFELALNYFSFALSASLKALVWAKTKRFDLVFVHEISPITVGIPAVIVKRLQKIPMIFWVLDLWPESMTAAGGVTNPAIINSFTKLTKWLYKNSDKILMSSKDFRQSILEKGDFAEKLHYFPNWADEILQNSTYSGLPSFPSGFIVMFAGNIGKSQDFEHIMQAALILKEEQDIHFAIVGDGRRRAWVESFIRDNRLSNVHCMGRHPLSAMGSFFAKADVLLVSLKDSPIFALTEPTKISAYMYAGKPIITMMNGAGPRLINEARCGFSVPAGDAQGLADTIKKASRMNKQQLEELGRNGRLYCENHFNFKKLMDGLCDMLNECTGKKQ